jgi:hypothetical protein
VHSKSVPANIYYRNRHRLNHMDRMRQKQVVVSIKNWKTLQRLGHLGMTMDDVITELLNMNMKIRAVELQGNRIPAQIPVAPASTGELRTHG